jgi:ABC-type multidrug transport system ATPase subunit
VIVLEGISKRFETRLALDRLDLRVAPGEVVALIGPNGAGKSTALRVLAGAIAPDAGRASIGGREVTREGAAARAALGYLPQKLGVPAATVVGDLAALVAAARGEADDRAALAALAQAGLGDRFDTPLAQLSGGQRQRVLLELATFGPVRALVLDEPSISLDAEGAEEARAVIRRARARGVAVLFASHHLHDVAALADRIVVLVSGRPVAAGTLRELAAAAGVAWTEAIIEAPIERIYRVLVSRTRGAGLTVVQGDAA